MKLRDIGVKACAALLIGGNLGGPIVALFSELFKVGVQLLSEGVERGPFVEQVLAGAVIERFGGCQPGGFIGMADQARLGSAEEHRGVGAACGRCAGSEIGGDFVELCGTTFQFLLAGVEERATIVPDGLVGFVGGAELLQLIPFGGKSGALVGQFVARGFERRLFSFNRQPTVLQFLLCHDQSITIGTQLGGFGFDFVLPGEQVASERIHGGLFADVGALNLFRGAKFQLSRLFRQERLPSGEFALPVAKFVLALVERLHAVGGRSVTPGKFLLAMRERIGLMLQRLVAVGNPLLAFFELGVAISKLPLADEQFLIPLRVREFVCGQEAGVFGVPSVGRHHGGLAFRQCGFARLEILLAVRA
ncbi:MAG: hypothetical protein U0992_07190 [Planctomycetaceae bacterium]